MSLVISINKLSSCSLRLPYRIPSSHLPTPRSFFLPSFPCPGVNSSALSIRTAGTTASASTVPLRFRLFRWLRFIIAATSLFSTSFLILGQSSLTLPDEDTDELLRWNGESDDNEIARDRDFDGGDKDACACFVGTGTAGRGILISVYGGLSSSSTSGDASGTTRGESSVAACGVVTAGQEESKSQKGSTSGITTSPHAFVVSMFSRESDCGSIVVNARLLGTALICCYVYRRSGSRSQHSHIRRPPV